MPINTAAVWLDTVLAEFDLAITLFINKLAVFGGGFFTPFFEFISFLCLDGIPLIIASVILMLFKRTRRFGTAMLIGLTIGALITNCCLKIIVARPRPYANEDSIYHTLWKTVGTNTESDKSFPSGHTAAAFASMTALFCTARKKRIAWTAFIFAFLVGISRIYLCVHYPTDVMTGIAVGVFSGIIGFIIMTRIPRRFYESDKPMSMFTSARVSDDKYKRKHSQGGKHCR